MTIVITAFDRSPDGGLGLARDTRVRWALEEVGLPYEVSLVSATSPSGSVSASQAVADAQACPRG